MKNIPAFLHDRQSFYVTESSDPTPTPRSVPVKRLISPATLSDLRPGQPGDYSDHRTAVDAVEEHPHWLDGIGIHIAPPLLVIVIRYCFQPSWTLYKPIREFMKGVAGYWEHAPLREDVWGVIWSPTPVVGTEGWFHGNRVLVFTEAHMNLTSEPFRGVTRDPGQANHERLTQLLTEIHR